EIRHGVVSTDGEGTITGTTGNWAAPGSTGIPFSGSVTSLDALNGDIRNVDAGDKVRFAIGVANTGGSGAFDISTGNLQVPDGFQLIRADGTGASNLADANLQIYRGGNGTLLVAGV